MNRALPVAAAAFACVALVAGCGSDDPTNTTTTTTETSPSETSPGSGPQPFNASGLLGGDADPTFPDGEAGQVSVVAQAPIEKHNDTGSAVLTFAFRNNTDAAISHVGWTATATADGKLVATGRDQGATVPAQIAPGEVGMSYVYFEAGKNIPETGATYEFTAETSPADTSSYNTAPLAVTESNRTGKNIIGAATNKTGAPVTGPYSVDLYCFDGNEIGDHTSDFTEEDGDIEPDGVVHFTVTLYDPCETYAVGVSGYFS